MESAQQQSPGRGSASFDAEDLVPASDGHGPLLQRDYWAVLSGGGGGPRAVAEVVRTRFWEFPPPDLVLFRRADGRPTPLRPGDRMEVEIRMVGETAVVVTHTDPLSLTVATVRGHPEAGRITFGAYGNRAGETVVHIRSRARASGRSRYLQFLAAGEPMQTNTWCGFLNRLSAVTGGGIRDVIHASTREVEDTDDDQRGGLGRPTFRAVDGADEAGDRSDPGGASGG